MAETHDLNWEHIIDSCDYNGDGLIDFEEFLTASIDKTVLHSAEDVMKIFRVLDRNNDGVITIEDFDDLFESYGGAKLDTKLWEDLISEADKKGDGTVTFEEFQEAMKFVLDKELRRKRRKSAEV